MEKKFVRIGEASKMLGVRPQTLRRWEKEGLIKPVRVGLRQGGGERRYNIDEIKALLDGQSSLETIEQEQ